MHTTLPAAETAGRATRWLLLCGVLAPPVLAVFVIAAAAVTPGYSHLSDTVSQLGARGRPHPEVMNAGFIVYALLLSGFAHGLYRHLGRSTGARAVWLLLTICGLTIILSAIFQDDSMALGDVTTLEGILHGVFAQIAFFALVIGMTVFARVVYLKPEWRCFTQFSLAVVVLNLVLSLMFLIEVATPVEGALQRSFFGLSLAWLLAVSLRALRPQVCAEYQDSSPTK